MKILIVDDNAEIRRLIKSLVADLADEIDECGDGAEAVETALVQRPDWILLDVFMKQMDGLTAAEIIKKALPNVKIAVVTNHTDNRTRRAAAEAGVDAFFGKDDLLALVELLKGRTRDKGREKREIHVESGTLSRLQPGRLRYMVFIGLMRVTKAIEKKRKGEKMKFNLKLAALMLMPLLFCIAGRAQETNPGQRLTPAEIEALAPTGAGAGTSGVSGIQTRVLKGDPTKPGLYTIQLTVPANTKIAAHDHPDDRIATVISGTWYIGYGENFDEKKLKPLTAGSFYTEPPGIAHFARTGTQPVVVQITGYGPTGTKYINDKEKQAGRRTPANIRKAR